MASSHSQSALKQEIDQEEATFLDVSQFLELIYEPPNTVVEVIESEVVESFQSLKSSSQACGHNENDNSRLARHDEGNHQVGDQASLKTFQELKLEPRMDVIEDTKDTGGTVGTAPMDMVSNSPNANVEDEGDSTEGAPYTDYQYSDDDQDEENSPPGPIIVSVTGSTRYCEKKKNKKDAESPTGELGTDERNLSSEPETRTDVDIPDSGETNLNTVDQSNDEVEAIGLFSATPGSSRMAETYPRPVVLKIKEDPDIEVIDSGPANPEVVPIVVGGSEATTNIIDLETDEKTAKRQTGGTKEPAASCSTTLVDSAGRVVEVEEVDNWEEEDWDVDIKKSSYISINKNIFEEENEVQQETPEMEIVDLSSSDDDSSNQIQMTHVSQHSNRGNRKKVDKMRDSKNSTRLSENAAEREGVVKTKPSSAQTGKGDRNTFDRDNNKNSEVRKTPSPDEWADARGFYRDVIGAAPPVSSLPRIPKRQGPSYPEMSHKRPVLGEEVASTSAEPRGKMGCFNCRGPHHIKECPHSYNPENVNRNRAEFEKNRSRYSGMRYFNHHIDSGRGRAPDAYRNKNRRPVLRDEERTTNERIDNPAFSRRNNDDATPQGSPPSFPSHAPQQGPPTRRDYPGGYAIPLPHNNRGAYNASHNAVPRGVRSPNYQYIPGNANVMVFPSGTCYVQQLPMTSPQGVFAANRGHVSRPVPPRAACHVPSEPMWFENCEPSTRRSSFPKNEDMMLLDDLYEKFKEGKKYADTPHNYRQTMIFERRQRMLQEESEQQMRTANVRATRPRPVSPSLLESAPQWMLHSPKNAEDDDVVFVESLPSSGSKRKRTDGCSELPKRRKSVPPREGAQGVSAFPVVTLKSDESSETTAGEASTRDATTGGLVPQLVTITDVKQELGSASHKNENVNLKSMNCQEDHNDSDSDIEIIS